ncbi:MAG: hypothetical protein K8S14_03685 [Actinomycetia bacterium]|nr:hypothetical protein [Actinomycetes bacterium]
MRLFQELKFLLDNNTNQSNIKLLSGMIDDEHISHAYLFAGNNMEQLHRLALSFAACINCRDGGCGHCSVCAATTGGVHPNVHIVEPEGNILRIGEISNLQRFMGMSAYGPGRKICIIKEAELMNTEAANRLLKTLEDPPDPESVFILLSEDTTIMLPTIVSRCLAYKWKFEFDKSKDGEADFMILERYLDSGLREIIGEGGVKPALLDLSLRILEISKKMEAGLKTGMEKEIAGIKDSGHAKEDISRYLAVLKSKHKRQLAKFKKLGISRVFDIISAWLEDIISVKMGMGREDLNFEKNHTFINNRLKGIKTGDILKLLENIEGNRMYLGYSLNSELALDNIFLQVKSLKFKR